MLAAMLLKLLDIFVGAVRVPFGEFLRHCMVALAAYLPGFGAVFAKSPAKIRFSGVQACR